MNNVIDFTERKLMKIIKHCRSKVAIAITEFYTENIGEEDDKKIVPEDLIAASIITCFSTGINLVYKFFPENYEEKTRNLIESCLNDHKKYIEDVDGNGRTKEEDY